MNFQQLRIIRETARRNCNLTEVASALFTSQSGVSKHIKDLEDELGVDLFVRKGKRLTGMTEPGRELVPIVERILADVQGIRRLGEHFAKRDSGELVIATTHTQARYALPAAVAAFKRAHPRVHLVLHQARPPEIVAMLQRGEADIGIATEALAEHDDIAAFPYYHWTHGVLVPRGHPLTEAPLTLEALAAWPIVTYHEGFAGRSRIDATFAKAGLAPDVVLSALDSDVIKTYVELGLGVGIVAPVAWVPERDTGLAFLPGDTLFPSNTTTIGVRRGHFLRDFAYRFIEQCAPALGEAEVRARVAALREDE